MRRKRSDRNHIIYRLQCAATNEFYIGMSAMIGRAVRKTLDERWRRHNSKAQHDDRGWALHDRLRKYPPEQWHRSVLCIVRGRALAFNTERTLIKQMRPTLNTF